MYALMMGICGGCNQSLTFNPHSVPSVDNKPLCAECVARMQQRQRKAGVPVWPDPLPNAYEPFAEELLDVPSRRKEVQSL